MTMDKSLLHIIQVLLYSVLRENFHPHRNNKLVFLNNLKFCVFVFLSLLGLYTNLIQSIHCPRDRG